MKSMFRRSVVSYADLCNLFWVFMIGCFLGVVIETIFSFVTTGRIGNPQGVIYGPFNPVYGFGILFLTLVMHPLLHKKWYIIFILCMLAGGGFEFLSSFLQQYATGTVSWQYQQLPFNLYGRTSLMYAFFWGVLGFLWVKKIDPMVEEVVDKRLHKTGLIITLILIILMLFDLSISFMAVKRWDERIQNIPAKNGADEFLDKTYPNSYLDKIYPNMTHVNQP